MRREYPDAPIAAVGAVVLDGEKVLLVRRRQAPLQGAWSIPGGVVEAGETVEKAVCREVLEETGLTVEAERLLAVLDRIDHDGYGRVKYHYILVEYRCRVTGGKLSPATDAEDVEWVARGDLDAAGLTAEVYNLILQAFG